MRIDAEQFASVFLLIALLNVVATFDLSISLDICMSTFNNGGGSLKATTKPGALLEVAHQLSNAEKTASTADNPVNNLTITFDLEANIAALAATLPIAATLNSVGNLVIAASDYLGGAASFNAGAGDLRATTMPSAFLEVAQIVAGSEQAIVSNTPNNVTIAMDLEGGTATVTAGLPITTVTDATGKVIVTAADYLP